MFSLFIASSWPCIPLVLNEHQIGSGYGILTSVYNTGLFSAPLIISYVMNKTIDTDQGYFYKCVFFITCAGLQMITAIYIVFENNI